MRWAVGLGLVVACSPAAEGEEASFGGTASGVASGVATGSGGGSTGTVVTSSGSSGSSSDGTSTGDGGTTGPDEWTSGTTMAPHEEGECTYAKVFEQVGAVLWVTEATSVWEVMPLMAGEGFYCMKVEFDLQTLDNVDTLAESEPGCPEYLGLASVFGTQATGEVMATAFYRGRDKDGEMCTAGASRIEVGNYLEYAADTVGPWAPGEAWHVTIEAKPWVTRIALTRGGAPLGPTIEANLWPASVADTRDPMVRLGQVMVVEGKYYPWFGATYANLTVWADVAPPG